MRGLLWAGLSAALLASWLGPSEAATARAERRDLAGLPRVFLPVAAEFARSPIPVYVPTWLPRIPKSEYRGPIYPVFQTFTGQDGTGAGYELGLFTSRRYPDHAHRLFGVYGAEAALQVDTHTRPVWLGKRGWAYLHSGTNVGTTLSLVRAANPSAFWPVYTYTLIYGCPNSALPWPRYLACLKHVADVGEGVTAMIGCGRS